MTPTQESSSAFPCKACGSYDIRRSHRQHWFEVLKMPLGIFPFRCLACRTRFYGNIWLRSTVRQAMCPKCLRFRVIPYPRKLSHLTSWQRVLAALGAHQYRCESCRHNFLSFHSQYVAEPGHADELTDG